MDQQRKERKLSDQKACHIRSQAKQLLNKCKCEASDFINEDLTMNFPIKNQLQFQTIKFRYWYFS